jgi:hypothetical protein
MENINLKYFAVALVIAFFLARTSAYFLMDKENYSDDPLKNNEKSKTITGLLRKNLGIDLHHIHFGIGLMVFLCFFLCLGFINPASIILLGISTSLIVDQIFPLLNFGNYFGYPMLMTSFLIHLIILESLIITQLKQN